MLIIHCCSIARKSGRTTRQRLCNSFPNTQMKGMSLSSKVYPPEGSATLNTIIKRNAAYTKKLDAQ